MRKRVRPLGQLSLPFAESESTDSGTSGDAAAKSAGHSEFRQRRRGSRRGSAPRSAGRQVACLECGKPLDLPEWFPEQVLELHYCGPRCRKAWARERPDAAIEIGARGWTRGANWEVQSALARERDGFACQVCGATEEDLGRRLDVHHTIPYGRFKSNVEANRLEYLMSVCAACHGQLESRLRRELPLFNRA